MSDILPVEVKKLFPTSVAKYQLSTELMPQLSIIVDRVKKEGMDLRMHYKSKTHYILEEYPDLKQYITTCVNDFMRGVLGIDDVFKITQSWVNCAKPQQMTSPHPHPNSIISGCMYLDLPNNDGQIIFLKYGSDNGQNTQYSMIPNYKPGLSRDPITSDFQHSVKVKNGDIVLFPSYAMHAVPPTNSGKDRWSLAFNSMPTITLGAPEGLNVYHFS